MSYRYRGLERVMRHWRSEAARTNQQQSWIFRAHGAALIFPQAREAANYYRPRPGFRSVLVFDHFKKNSLEKSNNQILIIKKNSVLFCEQLLMFFSKNNNFNHDYIPKIRFLNVLHG